MNNKILLTGAQGLLGRKIFQLSSLYPSLSLVCTARKPIQQIYPSFLPCDISNKREFLALLQREKPHTIIHTAAMTQVDQCEQEPNICEESNVAPIYPLISYAKEHKVHIIFLSTDFVYSGESDRFYNESDQPDPINYYGTSKLKAEKMLLEALPKLTTVFRTALVYGSTSPKMRKNFVTWTLEELQQNRPIKVVMDQSRCPTWVDDLAHLCLRAAMEKKEGIFHACGKNYLNIWQAVFKLSEIASLNKKLIHPIQTTDLHTAAKRPPSTPLSIKKAIDTFDYQPHDYEYGITKVLEEMKLK